jgi:rod shape-determining protein MreD
MAARRPHWLTSFFSLAATLALASVPLPDSAAPLRPDWVAVVLLYWSLMSPRQFSLLTAVWMGVALDTLTGALLGQNALALLVVVYLAEKFHLRLLCLASTSSSCSGSTAWRAARYRSSSAGCRR